MIKIKILSFFMSIILAVLLSNSNVIRRLEIDVKENDGRMVVWKESDYLKTDSDLIFFGRNSLINKVYVSYDDGKSYKLFLNYNPSKNLIINPSSFKTPVCIRFISDENHVSRQYKIKFLNCNTFT